MTMCKCSSCGYVFDEEEIVSWTEHHGEPHLQGEQWCGSPCCREGFEEHVEEPPYSEEDYEDALSKGLDLDDWSDYEKYYELGREGEHV